MFSVSDAHLITDPVLRAQVETHPRAQDLLRAFLYPYHAPEHDFVFCGATDNPAPMPKNGDDCREILRARSPVLAVGSNRAPRQLARKFSHHNLSDVIPVTHGWMDHHDIVYSPHVTGYGAFPATLAPSSGTRVRISVTWLTAAQLAHMHVTESVPNHYRYETIGWQAASLDCGITGDHLGLYQSTAGHRFNDGKTFALSAISAQNRQFTALSQWDIMARLAKQSGETRSVDFVLRLIDDPDLRKSIIF
ncbi:hypothetical protein LPB41_21710 [Thalassospira sp. MA62]|nr:hypothetical protein [Thalassospira sp. MA62]